MTAPLKKGDTVYRVVEHTEIDGSVGWRVQEATVKIAGKRITLARPFASRFGLQFGADAFGRLFFATPAEAVRDFAAKQRRNIESAARMVRDAEEALDWTERWTCAWNSVR